jgi:hypothetical protein
MGRDSNFYCETCKKAIYMGYGSYSSWLDHVENEDEFWEKSEVSKKEFEKDPDGDAYSETSFPSAYLQKNKNVLRALREHEGHRFKWCCMDWCEIRKDGHLYIEESKNPLVKNAADFEFLDWDKE